MKKSLVIVLLLTGGSLFASELKTKWFGFSQITAESGEGTNSSSAGRGLKFGADRIRIGSKVSKGDWSGKLQVDFMKSDDANIVGADEIIKDAVITYNKGMVKVNAGVFKTPVGYDFNLSGHSLDITKRGSLTKKLVLERAAGAMVSVQPHQMFGLDIGTFNPTARSGVVGTTNRELGTDAAYAARLRFDMDAIHAELSYGTMESRSLEAVASTKGQADYTVMDFALAYKKNGITAKGEYIKGENLSGSKAEQTAYYIHLGYMPTEKIDVLVRHYAASHKTNTTTSIKTDIGNTYIGGSYHFDKNFRVQANYVLVSGDDRDSTTAWGGQGGYTANVLLTQLQVRY